MCFVFNGEIGSKIFKKIPYTKVNVKFNRTGFTNIVRITLTNYPNTFT